MKTLTGFKRDILYVIAGKEGAQGTALEFKHDLGDYYEKEIKHGRLYPNLDSLVENGFLEKERVDRRTNSYRITDKGLQLLIDRREWENAQLEAAGSLVLNR